VAGPADELKELGDTFDDLLDRLDRAFQGQRRFIANASHELRSPLTRQRTITEVALADPDATAEALRAAHKRVLVAEMQQQRLIDALLALARGQAGLHQSRPVNLAVITAHVVEARQDEARRRGIALTGSFGAAATTGDPRLVERLVTNLVDNALQHNVPQGRVEIRTWAAQGQAHLDVSNTGPQVPADTIEGIFQPFRRLDTDRTHNDNRLGLGLSIVQAIADTHRATISACPRLAGGLHIRVSFVAAALPVAGALPLQLGSGQGVLVHLVGSVGEGERADVLERRGQREVLAQPALPPPSRTARVTRAAASALRSLPKRGQSEVEGSPRRSRWPPS
jgi:signal transduction histidine kinase